MMNRNIPHILFRFILLSFFLFCGFVLKSQELGIQPYTINESFWQYNNQPVLLLGGSNDENLFQNLNFVEELEILKNTGGNYVYCSLGSKNDGDEWPFWRTGLRFNLNKFNTEFWRKLDNFFKITSEQEIFVQLEVWDLENIIEEWDNNPWNPELNNVLTEENTNLKIQFNEISLNEDHNFFYSVPNLNNDSLLLSYQKMFVDQLLSITLKYDHILYCVSNIKYNEYSNEWNKFWEEYLRQKAADAFVNIQIAASDLNLDLEKDLKKSETNNSYFDASQNSFLSNEKHWEQLQKIKKITAVNPLPINNVEIYGGKLGEWTGGPEQGIERFWRNLIGGAASVRFYQPPAGLGISERAQMHIKSAKMLCEEYNFFTSLPNVNFSLLLERAENEAYFASNKNKDALVYFPDGGQVVIDFTDFSGRYKLKWLNTEGGNWYSETELDGGGIIELSTPFVGSWVALLKKTD